MTIASQHFAKFCGFVLKNIEDDVSLSVLSYLEHNVDVSSIFWPRAPNNDYSTESLQTVKELIYINLFDEVIVDMNQVI